MDFKKWIPNDLVSIDSFINPDVISHSISSLIKDSFAALRSDNYDKAERSSRVAMDAIWERLNVGHWKDVDVSWQRAYSLSALCRALAMILSDSTSTGTNIDLIKEALRICDMGLLMGASIDNRLTDIAQHIHGLLPVSRFESLEASAEQEPNSKRRKIIPQLDSSNSIPKLGTPSLETFQSEYLGQQKPCVISGALDHWPALEKWSLPFICKATGYRTVPVEIGSKYTDESWSQKLMTINDYVQRFFGNGKPEVGYLAQHRLFDQIAELKRDILIPDYCFCYASGDVEGVEEADIDINAWFGPAGTISPLHYDPRHNFLAQVIGKKYIRLYDPSWTDSIYPNDGIMRNTSRVDVENVDTNEFPNFVQAQFMECLLEPGEMLFIPKRWWHYVRSLDISFSVSFWFGDE